TCWSGFVFELAQREIARTGNQRRRRRTVASTIGSVACGAALGVDTLAWRCIGRKISTRRPD
ncbi:MAG: hypothetical protein L0Y56_01595, partial [Nitrospira sp.]|nr:hypothetical protein [Nitrospira sp.]